VVVGVPSAPVVIPSTSLVFKRATLGGSIIGGIQETQEMLDFCGEHNITANVEVRMLCIPLKMHLPGSFLLGFFNVCLILDRGSFIHSYPFWQSSTTVCLN
jgi:hypothetical protein